jgi:hypothetical protein
MKKSTTVLIAIVIAITLSAQRKTIYLSTDLPLQYQIYIDDELQYYGLGSIYKISGLTAGKKTLSIKTYTNSHQTPSVSIGTSSEKDEYYILSKIDDKYVINKAPKGFAIKKESYPTICSYISKRPVPKLDSNYKQPHSCKIEDSMINKIITQMLLLKDAAARQNLFNSSFNRKCLQSSQLRSIGYRLDDDKEKFDLYKKYFPTCVDRVDYKNLVKTFTAQEYTNQFENWMKDEN